MKTQKHSVSIGFYYLAYEHFHRPDAQLEGVGRRGGLPWHFLKIKKSTLILVKKAPITPFLGLSFQFKM